MQHATQLQSASPNVDGELFSVLLRLHPVEAGWVSPSSGSQAHAAFLDIVRQSDPALAEQLHQPNQRRPFTVGLLQGFNYLSTFQLDEAITENQKVQANKFAQAGFQGKIMYEMKGIQSSPEAAWLTPLAHFALFSGVGYKTSMGMGQMRCTNLVKAKAALCHAEQSDASQPSERDPSLRSG